MVSYALSRGTDEAFRNFVQLPAAVTVPRAYLLRPMLTAIAFRMPEEGREANVDTDADDDADWLDLDSDGDGILDADEAGE